MSHLHQVRFVDASRPLQIEVLERLSQVFSTKKNPLGAAEQYGSVLPSVKPRVRLDIPDAPCYRRCAQ